MLKIWGRNTSSNVQKAMWAIGEMGLANERIDVGGAYGRTKEPFYLAMNPNSLVPTLEEEDGFTMWESNSIIRYLAAKHQNRTLEPADLRTRARAQMWMDWQLTVMGPAMFPVFWGLIRTPPEKRDPAAIEAGKARAIAGAQILDAQLGKTRFLAGEEFSYGDIPPGVMCNRFLQLVTERPAMPNLDRWFAEIAVRPSFKEHVSSIPLS